MAGNITHNGSLRSANYESKRCVLEHADCGEFLGGTVCVFDLER